MLEKSEPIRQDAQLETGAVLGAHYNAAVSVPRLVFLVSPTCEVCASGARSAAQAVLALPATYDFRLYLVWGRVPIFQVAICNMRGVQ
ncbi:hypothetical protein, partial [Candidatus Entotheonella palauensis]|uniref:hypothetical protein n=1 Tax=Candidatus Entotheonella palauensis TaxID=93172 RepID=UPI001C4E1FD1